MSLAVLLEPIPRDWFEENVGLGHDASASAPMMVELGRRPAGHRGPGEAHVESYEDLAKPHIR